MAFYVYLLECSDKSLYCGFASNLEKRIIAHNKGRASKYTRSRLPARLVFFEKAKTKSLALKREAELKRLSREEKLALCSNKIIGGKNINAFSLLPVQT
jgi:putative endonuclease